MEKTIGGRAGARLPLPQHAAGTGSARSRGGPAREQWIDLAWTSTSGGTGFVLERASDPSFASGVTSFGIPAGTTSYRDRSVAARSTYYYRVYASANGQRSAASNVAGATTR